MFLAFREERLKAAHFLGFVESDKIRVVGYLLDRIQLGPSHCDALRVYVFE